MGLYTHFCFLFTILDIFFFQLRERDFCSVCWSGIPALGNKVPHSIPCLLQFSEAVFLFCHLAGYVLRRNLWPSLPPKMRLTSCSAGNQLMVSFFVRPPQPFGLMLEYLRFAGCVECAKKPKTPRKRRMANKGAVPDRFEIQLCHICFL